jgi:hypothetical protein
MTLEHRMPGSDASPRATQDAASCWTLMPDAWCLLPVLASKT